MNKRVVNLDILRVVATLMVIILHVNDVIPIDGIADENIYLLSEVLSLIAVPIFFMLSGHFLLNPDFYKNELISTFYKRRMIKVIIPFIMWSIFYTIVFGNNNLIINLANILIKPAAGHLWYMYPLIGFYLVAPWLRESIRLVDEKYTRLIIYLSFIFIVIGGTLEFVFSSLNINYYVHSNDVAIKSHIFGPLSTIFPLFGNIIFFMYGALAFKDAKRVSNKIIYLVLLSGLIITFMFGYLGNRNILDNNIAWWNYTLLGVSLQTVAAFWWVAKKKFNFNTSASKYIVKLSMVSMNVYFVHYFVIRVIEKIFPIVYQLNYLVSLLLGTLLVFIISIVISLVINKIIIMSNSSFNIKSR